jgi:hypothetical protein
MNKCGNCHWLVTNEGKPYYCALRDLYTFRDVQDDACSEYVEKDEVDNEKLQKTADNQDF